MRYSIPTRVELPPSPAVWYNANGYEWGRIGPNREQLDQSGNPIPPRKPTGHLRMFLAALLFAALAVGCAFLLLAPADPPTAPVPFHTPTVYGPPPTW